jgi:Na+-transporting methylmalonyl-CoA/oxaloacetate decarboxylase gamma subunit
MLTSKPEYDVGPSETKAATIPHDILIFNLIGNHILITVLVGGLAKTFPFLLALPVAISTTLISYTLWRAKQSPKRDTPFVQCHWAVAAKRTRTFLVMLAILAGVSGFAAFAHFYMGLMAEAAMALVGGMGILPVMVTLLILVIMESEALHMAKHKRAPGCPGILHEEDTVEFKEDVAPEAA